MRISDWSSDVCSSDLRLSVGIKVLEREGELAVDMAIILALLLGDRLGRQLFGIIIYRAVQRISAIFGEQQPRRGFEVRAAVAPLMFERRKAVETFVDRPVGRVLQKG